jgi:glycosyltransferase involved in cell wall biosynthesis
MRILQVNHFLDIGGSSTVLLTLAKEQRRLGHHVTICSMYGAGPLDLTAAEYGIPVVHLHSGKKRTDKIRALNAYLKRERYDVLHSHWGVWLATAVAGFLRGIPRIHTNHSNQPRRLFLEHRVACFFTDKVVVLTPELEPYIAKWVAVPRRKIEVIPNGVEFAALKNAARVEIEGIPPEAPVVGMVARLFPPKDYATFLRAAAIVMKERPEVHFVSVGNGQQREHFEQEAAALGLKNFHFLGGRMDVPSLLRRMTIAVLATKHEGQPVSLIEAMVSGTPVIGSDIPAVRFSLEDGASGLLVEGQNPEALAQAIMRLLDDPALRTRLIERAKVHSQAFHVSQMTQKYIALCERLIARTSKTANRAE